MMLVLEITFDGDLEKLHKINEYCLRISKINKTIVSILKTQNVLCSVPDKFDTNYHFQG